MFRKCFAIAAGLVLVASSSIGDGLKPIRLASGISKTFEEPFTLKKEHVLDITTEVLKAQERLAHKAQFYFHVERADDQFFEVDSLDGLFSDSNSESRPIQYLSWNLWSLDEKDYQGGDKPRRIAYVRFSREREQVTIRVSGDDMTWSIILGERLLEQVERTLKSRFNYTRAFIAFGFLLLYAVSTRFLLAILNLKVSSEAGRTLRMMIVQMPIILVPIWAVGMVVLSFDRTIAWFNYSPSVFLWGDIAESYGEANALEGKVLWGIFVALIVAVAANLLTAKLMRKEEAVSPKPQKGQT